MSKTKGRAYQGRVVSGQVLRHAQTPVGHSPARRLDGVFPEAAAAGVGRCLCPRLDDPLDRTVCCCHCPGRLLLLRLAGGQGPAAAARLNCVGLQESHFSHRVGRLELFPVVEN